MAQVSRVKLGRNGADVVDVQQGLVAKGQEAVEPPKNAAADEAGARLPRLRLFAREDRFGRLLERQETQAQRKGGREDARQRWLLGADPCCPDRGNVENAADEEVDVEEKRLARRAIVLEKRERENGDALEDADDTLWDGCLGLGRRWKTPQGQNGDLQCDENPSRSLARPKYYQKDPWKK